MIWIVEMLLFVPLSMASLINATIGLSVLLPCIIPPPPPPLKDTLIYWQTVEKDKKDTSLLLHFYDKGEEVHNFTNDKYKNRTALDLSQLPSGNFSLVLKNVTKEDNLTTIRCLYSTRLQTPQEVNRSTLLVQDMQDTPDEPDPDPVSFPVWATGLLIAVPSLLLVACVAWIACKGTEACRDGDTGLTVNGTVHREQDSEQQIHIPLTNGQC